MWRAVIQIIRQSGVYSKQLNLFLAVVFLVGVILLVPSLVGKGASASTVVPISAADQVVPGALNYSIAINRAGMTTINGRAIDAPIEFGKSSDSLVLILSKAPVQPIDVITVDLQLPRADQSVRPEFYAIHGVGSSTRVAVSSTEYRFTAVNIPTTAEISVNITFPKGYFALSGLNLLRSDFASVGTRAWVDVTFIIPGLSLLYLLLLVARRRLGRPSVSAASVTATPPESIQPAVIGVLFRGKIGRPEITATLLDLANRGFLTIHTTLNGETVYAKGKALFTAESASLQPFEIFFLHQLLGDEPFKATNAHVSAALNNELFSDTVSHAMVNIYAAAVARGYYTSSPNRSAITHRYLGLTLFFISFAITVYSTFALPEPAYSIFLWVGMLVASLLIIYFAPSTPKLTKTGRAALAKWLGYRSYLVDDRPIDDKNPSEFFAALPYAVALGAEAEWAKRWQDAPPALPEWYTGLDTPEEGNRFLNTIITIIGQVASSFQAARRPDLA